MNPLLMLAEDTPALDVTGITNTVTVAAVTEIFETIFPLVGVAILIGIVFYVVRYAIRLFRGV